MMANGWCFAILGFDSKGNAMTGVQAEVDVLALPSGQALNDADQTNLWRLESGALRVDTVSPESYCGYGQLVLPGDLIGLEHRAGIVAHLRTHAIMASRLVRVSLGESQDAGLLLHMAAVAQVRCRSTVSLRSGPVAERIKRLFLTLADAQPCASDMATWERPSLKDIAAIVAATPETVSRVIGGFRQLQLISGSTPTRSVLCLDQLRAHPISAGMTSSVAIVKQKALRDSAACISAMDG